MDGKKLICPSCYNKGLYKHGFDRGYQRWECNICNKRSIYPIEDLDLVKENSKLAKQKQNLQDLNRIERKSFREHARIENAISSYTHELIKIFESNRLNGLVLSLIHI